MSMEEKKVIKKKKKKKGARTAVILALVLASGVGGAFLWKQKKGSRSGKNKRPGADGGGSGHGHHLRADGIQLPVSQGYL